MNISERLANLHASPIPVVTDEIIREDLWRGRMALKRSRLRRGVGGLGFAFVVAASVTLMVRAPGSGFEHRTTNDGVGGAQQSEAVRLVAYAGKQLPGFKVDRVPEGFVLQGSTSSSLVLARQGEQSPVQFFVDKILVSLQSADVESLGDGVDVTVKGSPGVISQNEGTRMLQCNDGKNSLLIQVWSGIELTDSQIVSFAEGISVTSEAIAPAG